MTNFNGEPPRRPLPLPPPESLGFWEAARHHKLKVPRCDSCEQAWFPPSGLCPNCLSDKSHWEQVSGCGKVFSFVVVHRVYNRYFADKVPYVVAVIELAEGPRLLSHVVDVDPAVMRCGLAVEVLFDDAGPGSTLPKFRPSAAPPA